VLVVMAVLIVVYDFVTLRTTIGRRIYALGGNEKAARLSGIKTQRLAFLTFVNMGVLAALAGLVFAARLNTATPKAGLGFELDVIAACFIGGASASGGVGKVFGAVIGAFVMGVMNNGMSILGIGIDYQQVIKGLVLLAAVFVDVYNKSKVGGRERVRGALPAPRRGAGFSHRLGRSEPAGGRTAGAHRARHRRDAPAVELFGGGAADGGDCARARRVGQGADPRRADVEPGRRRGGKAVRGAEAPARRRAGHRLRDAFSEPDVRGVGPHHRAAQWQLGG
jgi:hypothetical protein